MPLSRGSNVSLWLLADSFGMSAKRPLYPRKQTSVARQIFGLKKRTSDDRFDPETRYRRGISQNSEWKEGHQQRLNH